MSWYTSLARPLLFALDAERAHDLTMAVLRSELFQEFLPSAKPAPSLRQTVFGIDFSNPVGLAAGLDKQGTAVNAWRALGFGSAEIGTITPRPQPGNPKPRLFRLRQDLAIINRFGFNSEGAAAVARHLATSNRGTMRLGVNVGKNKDTANERAVDDYVAAIEMLHPLADYFVVNVSSPNTTGLRALQDAQTLRPLLEQCVAAVNRVSAGAAGAASRAPASGPRVPAAAPAPAYPPQAPAYPPRIVPVLVKVSPDMTENELLRSVDAALEGGAAGVIASNTTTARAGLSAPASLTGETGGLSGAPLRQAANDTCRLLFRHLGPRVPIVGAGGIASAADAYERIRSGASLIQIYTALIYEGPGVVAGIIDGLAERLSRDGFTTIGDAIGADIR